METCPDASEDALCTSPRKVLVDEKTVEFFKLFLRRPAVTPREFDYYKRIEKSSLGNEVPFLVGGNVCSNDGNTDSRDSCPRTLTLNVALVCPVDFETSISVRTYWEKQVRGAVNRLHQAGIIWGDTKADSFFRMM